MSAIVMPTDQEILDIGYPDTRYSEALDAIPIGPLCRQHRLRIDMEASRWDCGDGYAVPGTPDPMRPWFFFLAHHLDPVDPWCCLEAWAHGTPDGSLVVQIQNDDPYPVVANKCVHNTRWRRSRLAECLWLRWGFFGRDEHLSASHQLGNGQSAHVCTPSKWEAVQ